MQGVGEVLKLHAPLPTWQEQGLCMGSTFWVAATNGVDPARRIKIAGFCRSKVSSILALLPIWTS